MRYILLQFSVREGDREHTHRVLFTTKCKNIKFAINWYLYHYWGNSFRYDSYIFALGGEIAYKFIDYTELSEKEYDLLYKLFK